MSQQHGFVLVTFSHAMLYFLFRAKRSYRVRQGSQILAVHRLSSVKIVIFTCRLPFRI